MFSDELKKYRLIPVVVIDDALDAEPLADAVVSGGLSCVEITLRTDVALKAILTMAKRTDLIVGAGTVLNIDQAKAAIDNGARFVVSPGMSMQLVEWCQQHAVPVFPGCATPTEILLALEAGLKTVKFFPAEQLGGARLLSTLGSVFQSMQFMPTGGITSENLAGYLDIKQVVACGGSWMVQPQWIRSHQFSRIHDEVKQVVKMIN